MRRSSSERRAAAAWGAVACLAYLACSPPEPPRAPVALQLAVSAAPPPVAAPPPSPRRRGRTLLAEPQDIALDFVLEPIPGGRSVLAVSQHAGEREAWARRIDPTGAQGPLVHFVDQHVLGAFDRSDGATTLVTSDGTRLCFRGASARPEDRACIQTNPAAVVPVGDRLALLELTSAHPPAPAGAHTSHPAPHPAPRPKQATTAPKPAGHHTTKGAKKRPPTPPLPATPPTPSSSSSSAGSTRTASPTPTRTPPASTSRPRSTA